VMERFPRYLATCLAVAPSWPRGHGRPRWRRCRQRGRLRISRLREPKSSHHGDGCAQRPSGKGAEKVAAILAHSSIRGRRTV